MPKTASPMRIFGWLAWGVVLVVIVVGIVAYLTRNAIAHRLAASWLKDRGLAYSIDVQSLSLSGFTGKVRIGDPTHPELVIPRVVVAYEIASPLGHTPFKVTTKSIRLISPSVRIGWDGRRLQLGSLAKVLAALSRQPPDPHSPKPDLIIQQGSARIDIPGGVIRLDADALVRQGRLTSFSGRIEPANLRSKTSRLTVSGGPIDAIRHGQDLILNAATDLSIVAPGFAVDQGALKISAVVPSDPANFAGRATADADFTGAVRTAQAAASDIHAHLSFRGDVSPKPQSACLNGVLAAQGQARLLTITGIPIRNPTVRANLSSLRVLCSRGAVSIQASGAGAFDGGGISYRDVGIDGVSGSLSVHRLVAEFGSTKPTWRADFRGDAVARGITAFEGRLDRLNASLSGTVNERALQADATLGASGGLAAAPASRLAGKIPILGAEAPYRTAIESGLRGFTLQPVRGHLSVTDMGNDVRLADPIVVQSKSGGRLDITSIKSDALISTRGSTASGALGLKVQGGGLPDIRATLISWSSRNGAIAARMQLAARMNILSAHDAVLSADGQASFNRGRFTFDLTRCEDETATEILIGGIQTTGFSGSVCPTSAPLISSEARGWRVRGRLEKGAGHLPLPDILATKAAADFDLSGDAQGPRAGSVTLDAIETHDAQTPHRFSTMTSRGRLILAAGVWRGQFETWSAAGHSLALESLHHDVASGLGEAKIDAGNLNFVANGVQPTEISPMLDFARKAAGRASFGGQFSWSPSGMTSTGDLTLMGIDVISPLGPLQALAGGVHFTSLAPISTLPGQRLTVAKIDAIVPLERLETTFTLSPTDITIENASMTVANGRISSEPMHVAFAPDAALSGALDLDHVDLGQVIAATSLSQSVKLSAVVDGRIAFGNSPKGFEITSGHLVAVKQGRLSILRSALQNVQTPGAAGAVVPPNAIQDLAFQAMEDLAFDQLEATLESRPAGRLGILFHIKGRHDPPHRVEANLKIADLIKGTAFKQSIPLPSGVPINLTLDTSLNFHEILAALQEFWRGGKISANMHSPSIQAVPAKITPNKDDKLHG